MKDKIVEKSIRTVNKQTGTVFYTISEDDLNHLYSAGEEVSAEEFLNQKLNIIGNVANFPMTLTFKDVWELMEEYAMITRPTVSEEEIDKLALKEYPDVYDDFGMDVIEPPERVAFANGIRTAKELLNR